MTNPAATKANLAAPAGAHIHGQAAVGFVITTRQSDPEPDRDVLAALAGLAARVPVSETVHATRTALAIAGTLTRQEHALLALQQENTHLRERLTAGTTEADSQRQRAQRAEAETTNLRTAIQVLVEPPSRPNSPETDHDGD
jgi:hypothetical protein